MPPLRERREDIALLIEKFLDEERSDGVSHVVAPETIAWLAGQCWRGNVRELRQALRRAVAFGGPELRPEDFGVMPSSPLAMGRAPAADGLGDKQWHELERDVIAQALHRHGSIRAAATALGRPKSTLADRARRYGLSAKHAAQPGSHRRAQRSAPPDHQPGTDGGYVRHLYAKNHRQCAQGSPAKHRRGLRP